MNMKPIIRLWSVRLVVLAQLAASSAGAQSLVGKSAPAVSLAGSGVAAPSAHASSPLAGYFFDVGHPGLQAIVGIPGSARTGGFLAAPDSRAFALAPSLKFALFSQGAAGRATLQPLEPLSDPSPLVGLLENLDLISISPSGAAAVLYSSQAKRAQIVTGLPRTAVGSATLELAGLAGKILAVAVNDAGDLALAVAGSESAPVLYALKASAAPAALLQLRSAVSMTFLPGGSDVLLADRVSNSVMLIRDAAGAASVVSLADANSGLRTPVAVAYSAVESRAFAADASGQFFTLPFNGAAPSAVQCDCQPTQLQRMHGSDLFLLTSSSQSALVLIDAETTPRISRAALVPLSSAAVQGDYR